MAIAAAIIGVVVVLVGGLLAFAASKPSGFHYERSAQVDSPPEAVFPIINDLHNWDRWSPWEKRDPKMKKTHSGAESGPGAVYEWEGNGQVGAGRMTVMKVDPPRLVNMKLEFFKPFVGTNDVNFHVVPSGTGSKVTWAMDGKSAFPVKVMSIFMDMDKMIGRDFEEGLSNLNAVASGRTPAPSTTC